ncbi:MAG: penicillin-binding transpeptidase domain-containing protein [Proteobacteria bacterium]|jgi:cell division protein FtsI/penicillin-binding protein 2|nr:penicillin-binding transpeptidase domain-containing protein [Pseudomonadota bacterium]
MRKRNFLTLVEIIALLATCSFTLGAAPAERSAQPEALRDVSPAAMALDGARYSQTLEDGRSAVFTVQPELQKFASSLLEDNDVPTGAIVVLNARTGRVLALAQRQRGVESPTVAFDPSPPAASLFKIVTTAALLERPGVSLDTVQCYHGGSQRLEEHNLVDSERDDTACASISQALGRSINAVIAKLADRYLEASSLLRVAEHFGFNRAIPFDFAVPESQAEIPSDRLERARAAAGFWHTHLSPLHAAMMVQAVAHDGAMLRPYIVDKVVGRDGALLYEGKPQLAARPISADVARRLRAAMRETVANGTARKAFHKPGLPSLAKVRVAGKTGTLTGRSPYRAYSWFAGFAPLDSPEVVVAVLIVNEPLWRIKSSETAALVLDKYFSLKKR